MSNSCSTDVPPFHGYVETTVNALRLIHAARQGVIPRITRRLNDTERRSMIRSGAVFVFSVEESGIKRWTGMVYVLRGDVSLKKLADGLLWSPSRIVGNFLVYREINERASSRGSHKRTYTGDDSRALSTIHRTSPGSPGYKGLPPGHPSSEQGTFKPNGLIKKTITVTVEGSDLHLISYYTSEDIRSGKLRRPSSRLDIMALDMPPHIFRLTNFRVPPKVEIGPDGKPRLVSEAEDEDIVECKIEEHTYNSPSLSPIDHSPTESSLYQIPSLGTSSSLGYARGTVGGRWPTALEGNIRMSMRQETPWPVSPTNSHTSHSIGSRRDSVTSQNDSWSPPSLHASSRDRWQSDSYENSLPSPDLSLPERGKIRASNPYQSAPAMRDHDGPFGMRYPGHISRHREVGQHRPAWPPINGNIMSSNSKETREPSQLRPPYPSTSPSVYTSTGYHSYGSTWASESAVLESGSDTPYSPQQSYSSSYTTHSD